MDLDRTLAATRLPPSCTPDTNAKKNVSTMPEVTRKCSILTPTLNPEKNPHLKHAAGSLEQRAKKEEESRSSCSLLYALCSLLYARFQARGMPRMPRVNIPGSLGFPCPFSYPGRMSCPSSLQSVKGRFTALGSRQKVQGSGTNDKGPTEANGGMEYLVTKNERVAENCYRLTLDLSKDPRRPIPGQFYNFRCTDNRDALLRRPFSVHRLTEENGIPC